MFKLDMESILKSGNGERLMANPANVANLANSQAVLPIPSPYDVEKLAKLAGLAALAISHGANVEKDHVLESWLIAAAMKVCDRHGDDEAARETMRRECLELSPEMQRDLLAHFQGKPVLFH